MKPFIISKLWIVLLSLGGTLLLSPQSEIAPDHFDGTDSWAAAAAAKVPASQNKSHAALATLQARNNGSATPKLETVAAHEVTAPRRSNATANKKRKPATKVQQVTRSSSLYFSIDPAPRRVTQKVMLTKYFFAFSFWRWLEPRASAPRYYAHHSQ
jgi:hypothetical protein